MLTQDFCDFLEYQISGALRQSTDNDRRRFWCDGVLMPEMSKDNSTEQVKATKRILTQAWIDEGRIKGQELGQTSYNLTIRLNDKSLERFVNGLDLTDCVPDQEDDTWISMDVKEKDLEIRLL